MRHGFAASALITALLRLSHGTCKFGAAYHGFCLIFRVFLPNIRGCGHIISSNAVRLGFDTAAVHAVSRIFGF